MAKIIFILSVIMTSSTFAQNWQFFNPSRIYYYKASNSGEIYTLRETGIVYSTFDSTVFFGDNYIPCDSCAQGLNGDFYYTSNGSVLGKEMQQKGDSLWLDAEVLFVNNTAVGNSHLFSAIDATSITHDFDSDTTIFGIPDSIRYYSISDGSIIIQSKEHGIISYPKQHTDSSVVYTLYGIEGILGQNFDDYNLLFNFQIGDVLFYRDWYSSYDGFSITYDTKTSDYTLTVSGVYILDGNIYYQMDREGVTKHYTAWNGDIWYTSINGTINYPSTYYGMQIDFPGEPIRKDRGPTINEPFNDFIQENIYVGHIADTINGNYVHFGGVTDINQVSYYETFGAMSSYSSDWDYSFCSDYAGLAEYPCDMAQNPVFISYEEGFGRTHFLWDGFEQKYSSDLMGAVIQGDTLGLIALNIDQVEFNNPKFYPNPATNIISAEEPLKWVKIYSSDGKLILSKENVTELNISQFSMGIYFIKMVDSQEQEYEQKLIVK